MTEADVTVFGGSGFLGRRITARLAERGLAVRVAVRHPERFRPPPGGPGRIEAVKADVHDTASVEDAVRDARAVVNAVSLYVEGHGATFRSVHVDGARRVARTARALGTERLLHISGLGADPAAPSRYERIRGEGEGAVRAAFPRATIFRPGVIFGPGDAFLTTLVQLLRRLPVIPLFGRGNVRLQPVYVEDVAEAGANALTEERRTEPLYELGGPTVFIYRNLLERIMDITGTRRPLTPFPFAGWNALATATSALPSPPITRSQIALMTHDNVASPDLPGLRSLGVRPTELESVLRQFFAPPPRRRPNIEEDRRTAV